MKKQYFRNLVALLLVAVLSAGMIALPASCAEERSDTAITIKGSKYVAKGLKVTLTANGDVTWKSSDKKIATVSSKGVVKGIKPGKVTITAVSKADKTVKKAWKMTVLKSGAKTVKITASTKKLNLTDKKTVTLKAKISPSAAAQTVTWKSSNTKVAKVSSKGKVTAVSAGKATITATATDGSKKKASVTITVEEETKAVVGVSIPTDWLQRWADDGQTIKNQLTGMGYDVILKYADNDPDTQADQIAAMIKAGCKVLIVAAVDGGGLVTVLEEAKEKGIPVIAYDRLLMNTDAVSYYVTFDSKKVGSLQGKYIKNALKLDEDDEPYTLEITAGDTRDNNARLFYDGAMSVLKSYIQSGKLIVKSGQTAFEEVATEGWRSDNAAARAEEILSSYYADGTDLDAWLCSNDSTAYGVISALDNCYSGQKWPVITGQDCDIMNVKLILQGKQAMSVFKVTSTLAKRAAKMAGQIIRGEEVEVNNTKSYNNNVIIVPSYLCAPVAVDKTNYKKYLIDSGIYSEDQLQ